jgi:signal transduction histidine kinase
MKLSTLRGSLRIRLLAGTLFWIAASILVAGWGMGNLFRQHVTNQFYAELTTHLDQLTAQLALDEKGHPQRALTLSDPRLSRPYSGYYWQVDLLDATTESAAAAGQLRSRSLWDYVLIVPTDAPGDGEIHQHRVAGPENRILGMVERSVQVDEAADGKARRFRLIAAADERFMAEPIARFSNTLWLALGVLATGLIVAALVQVFVGLAPLHRVRIALSKVRDGQTQQLEGRFPGEIMPLIEEFNSVLTQNAEVVARARTHAGNLAHALKTPLSVLANAANEQDAGSSELARLVVDQVAIARRQVDYHLARAKAAATSRTPGARTVLQPVIDGMARAMRRIHVERNIELTIAPFPASLSFRGETQDLQEMLGNLLDNACKWARTRVELRAQVQGSHLIITIDDDGSGLPATQRETVIARGVRADEQVTGSGLGLSIVNDLAHLYGGQLELADSPLGGLRALLTLPVVEL